MRDVQWSFLSIAIPSFIHFFLRVVLGRELGASGLGLYTLVFTIYMFGMQFASFGIGSALTKYIAEHNGNRKKVNEFVTSGMFASFISGLLTGAFLYLFSNAIGSGIFHNTQMDSLLKITAICFPFISLQKAVLGTLNGLRKMDYFAFLNIIQNIMILFVSIFLVIYLKMDVNGAVLGFVGPTIFTGLFSLFLIKDHFISIPRYFGAALKELSWFGFYVMIANSIEAIYTQIDSLMIGYFMDNTEVGYYSVAVILIQGILLLPAAIQQVTSPAIAEYHGKNDYKNIVKLMKNVMLRTFIITIFLSGLLAFFGRFMIGLFFTDEFLPAYTPILILLLGYSIQSPMVSVGGTLASIGQVKIIFKISAFSALTNTVLNILLIPKFGIIGAASATSLSLIIAAFIKLILLKKYVYDYVNNGQIES